MVNEESFTNEFSPTKSTHQKVNVETFRFKKKYDLYRIILILFAINEHILRYIVQSKYYNQSSIVNTYPIIRVLFKIKEFYFFDLTVRFKDINV